MASWFGGGTTRADVSKAVDELVSRLQGYQGIKMNEIVQGGSLGHGTALPRKFDIDLVIYSQDISAVNVLQHGYKDTLDAIDSYLAGIFPRKYKFEKVTPTPTPCALQFTFKGYLEVDLLVSPFWQSPKQLFDFLHTAPEDGRQRFHGNASKWQTQFFEKRDKEARELIKRAKTWRNKKWGKGTGLGGRPKSYLISAIVLRAYENASRRVSGTNIQRLGRETTAELISMVHNHRAIDIYWEDLYKLRDHPTLITPGPPRIIDPANPANDLYQTGFGRSDNRPSDYDIGEPDWTTFQAHIDTIDLARVL